jgi:hypothetical protein
MTRWGFWRRSRSRSGYGINNVGHVESWVGAAYLVGLLLLQLLEDLLRLRLGSKCGHVDVNIFEDTDKGLRCSRVSRVLAGPYVKGGSSSSI